MKHDIIQTVITAALIVSILITTDGLAKGNSTTVFIGVAIAATSLISVMLERLTDSVERGCAAIVASLISEDFSKSMDKIVKHEMKKLKKEAKNDKE